MKMSNAMIDFKNDKMFMFSETLDIIHTDYCHYSILINNMLKKTNLWMIRSLILLAKTKNVAFKVHRVHKLIFLVTTW